MFAVGLNELAWRAAHFRVWHLADMPLGAVGVRLRA
jgi:hypothetical protein